MELMNLLVMFEVSARPPSLHLPPPSKALIRLSRQTLTWVAYCYHILMIAMQEGDLPQEISHR